MSAKDRLEEYGIDDEIMTIDEESFDKSLIGVTAGYPIRAVYDFDTMIHEFAQYHGCSYQDAQDYIEFNIIRSLPYYGNESPVIIDLFET